MVCGKVVSERVGLLWLGWFALAWLVLYLALLCGLINTAKKADEPARKPKEIKK